MFSNFVKVNKDSGVKTIKIKHCHSFDEDLLGLMGILYFHFYPVNSKLEAILNILAAVVVKA